MRVRIIIRRIAVIYWHEKNRVGIDRAKAEETLDDG